jgi:hypothetical protein
MAGPTKPITIGKLDAARRQLQTAIILWFNDGDQVCIHVLAYAVYEIVHAISKKRNPSRRDLLFDSLHIREEKRAEFNTWIKAHANFFKHGDRDGEAVIDFRPTLSELFILFAIVGLEAAGERHGTEEQAYLWWLELHNSDLLTDEGRKLFEERFSIDEANTLRRVSKSQFLETFQ